MVRRAQRLDELAFRLAVNYRTLLHDYNRGWITRLLGYGILISGAHWLLSVAELDAGTEAVVCAFRTQLAARRAHTERLAAQLDALSPVKILERGYALVFDANGALVKDATKLAPGARFPPGWHVAALRRK